MKCIIFVFITSLISCQKAPLTARAANPDFKLAKAPMESSTSNATFLATKSLLMKLLDKGDNAPPSTIPNEIQKYLPSKAVSKLEQKMIVASYAFDERRFIDAAHLLSEILDENGKYRSARTLLARCFYFLGNEQRALKELAFVLRNQHDDLHEVLDALYLSGAIPLEANTKDAEKIKNAIGAFETYLKIATQSPERETINKAIATLKSRLPSSKKKKDVDKN